MNSAQRQRPIKVSVIRKIMKIEEFRTPYRVLLRTSKWSQWLRQSWFQDRAHTHRRCWRWSQTRSSWQSAQTLNSRKKSKHLKSHLLPHVSDVFAEGSFWANREWRFCWRVQWVGLYWLIFQATYYTQFRQEIKLNVD